MSAAPAGPTASEPARTPAVAPPTASTRVLALLGDPVEHSLSPVFQNAALRALGLDAVYTALRCTGTALPGLLRGLAEAGGAGNVTVPHKQAAAACVDRRTPAAERTGACNTFWAEQGRVWGDNTDVQGFAGAARRLLGAEPTGARVLLLGAGGAARAVLWALHDAAAAEVVVVNRTPERAHALAAHFADAAPRIRVVPERDALAGERYQLVVNATSLGLGARDPLPLAPERLAERADAALDLVYAPGGTRWVRALRERGVRADDGAEMLLQQGAAAFRRWWGREAPLEAMRAALQGAHATAP